MKTKEEANQELADAVHRFKVAKLESNMEWANKSQGEKAKGLFWLAVNVSCVAITVALVASIFI